ncbi:MAG: NADPH-dependent FMN reductase [Sandaracinaceae bacterium]
MSDDAIPVRLLAILGSLGARSSNRTLLERARDLAPDGVDVAVFDSLGALPFFDPDLDPEGAPHTVLALRRAIAESDALVIACPEYGFSLPGVLKNAIDWLIGSGELERKVIAITASVPHAERGRKGLAALRQTLSAVSAQVPFDRPIARGDGEDAAIRDLLTRTIAPARIARDTIASQEN